MSQSGSIWVKLWAMCPNLRQTLGHMSQSASNLGHVSQSGSNFGTCVPIWVKLWDTCPNLRQTLGHVSRSGSNFRTHFPIWSNFGTCVPIGSNLETCILVSNSQDAANIRLSYYGTRQSIFLGVDYSRYTIYPTKHNFAYV